MAFNEILADRIRALVADHETTERKMFGGWCILHNGNMVVGIVREDLMVRIGAPNYERALARPHTRPMEFTGRPMKGMLFVDVAGTRTDAQLEKWVGDAMSFVATLPPKVAKAR
jgi:TfoX/Sxy family transcriptional regulator of competence genes